MGKLTVRALRAVLVVVLTGTVCVQALMVWALVSGNDPEDGSLPLTALRVITILGIGTAQVALVSVWRLVTMVRRGPSSPTPPSGTWTPSLARSSRPLSSGSR